MISGSKYKIPENLIDKVESMYVTDGKVKFSNILINRIESTYRSSFSCEEIEGLTEAMRNKDI